MSLLKCYSVVSLTRVIVFFFTPLLIAHAPPSHAQKSESFTLNNGLQVITVTNRRVPAISFMIWYKVGAIDEEKGKSGIAHFLEHLMFKETEHLNTGEFSELVSSFGGDNNAFTTQDSTAYFQTIAKEHINLVMLLEAERMTGLKFDEETVKKERDIIIEERSMRVDNNPKSSLSEQMNSALYLSHPYGKPVIGWKHEIEKTTLNDAQNFYNKYYSPNNAILVVSGDITAEELKPLAEKYFGKIKPMEIPARKTIREPSNTSKRFVSLKDKRVKKSEWVRYYLAPSAVAGKTKHSLPLVILSQVLGGGETSKLYQSLVMEKEIATQAASYYDEMSFGETTFSIYITPKENIKFSTISNLLEKEISKIAEGNISEEEISRAKNLLNAEAIYAKDGFKNMAYIYGSALSIGLDKEFVETWPQKINLVTKKEIIDAAKYVLKTEKSVTGTLIPEK